ncbi:uncharacterized protein LOC110364119 isoform X2 [Columba livia]|uniref:uncharacterized protein LOC110364119 isoform X2 n=1 Tax=Columba livia TaxID=8932 RepID=UPI0031BA2286
MSPEQSKWGGEGWQSSSCPQSHHRWSGRDTNPCTASSPRGLAGVYPVRAVAEEEDPCMGKGAEPGSGSRCPPRARPLGAQSTAGGWSWGRHLCVPLHRVPMGRQRVPPVPRWRQLLHAGCWRLLSLSGTVLRGLRGLWRLLWYLLICYKMCWDSAFQVTEEVTVPPCPRSAGAVVSSEPQDTAEPSDVWPCRGCRSPGHHMVPQSGSVQARCPVSPSVPALHGGFQLSMALRARLESGSEESEEEEDGGSTSVLEPGQAGQRRGDPGEAVLGRLEALEADVQFLCTELGAEKLLWSSRFLELLQEQQGLRQRLQERPWRWDSGDSPELPGEAEDECASRTEGESPAGGDLLKDTGGWSHAGTRPRAQAAFRGQQFCDR